MKIRHCLSVFAGMIGLFAALGSAYGGYPPPGKILAHLLGRESSMSDRFKRLFCEVQKEAKEAELSRQPDPRKLVGEERGFITLPDAVLSDAASLNSTRLDSSLSDEREEKERRKVLYLADGYGTWLRRYFADGDFLIKVDGLTIFESDDIDKLMKYDEYCRVFKIRGEDGCWKEEWYAALTDVFKTLASEVFMRRLLGEETVRAFFDYSEVSRTTVYVFCYPSRDKRDPSTVSFHLMYRQVLRNEGRAHYPLQMGFDFRYDIGNGRFTDKLVTLSPSCVEGCSIRIDERTIENR